MSSLYGQQKETVFALRMNAKELAVMRRAVVMYEDKLWADFNEFNRKRKDGQSGFSGPSDSWECRSLLALNAEEVK
jgi:hypothetical protein